MTNMKMIIRIMMLGCLAGVARTQPPPDNDHAQTPFKTEKPFHNYTAGGNWSDDRWQSVALDYLRDGGVYVAARDGDGAFDPDNRIGLDNRNTIAIHVSANGKFIGTDGGGIYRYNSGLAEPKYEQKNSGLGSNLAIYDITEYNSILYAATANGVYKSSNWGDSWSHSGLSGKKINCLYVRSTSVFAGSNGDKVYRSDDNGSSWAAKGSGIGSGDEAKIIDFTYGDNLLFLVARSGSVYSSGDNGDNWTQKDNSNCSQPSAIAYAAPSALYKYLAVSDGAGTSARVFLSADNGTTFSNTAMEFVTDMYDTPPEHANDLGYYEEGGTKYLLCATEQGVYRTSFLTNAWNDFTEKELMVFGQVGYENQNVTRLFISDDHLYAGLRDKELYPGAEIVTTPHPKHWGLYNCHTYAWHIAEGGTAWTSEIKYNDGYIENPNYHIDPPYNGYQWDKSYHKIETTDTDFNELWEKIEYRYASSGISYGHSGTRDPDNPSKVISKWNAGLPLVRHDPGVLFSYADYNKDYYTASKKVSGTAAANEYVKIGRRILSTQTVQAGNDVKYEIAKMKNANIILKTGFHAQAGTTFRAFVSGVGAPYLKSVNGKISVWNKEDTEAVKASGQMEIYPNPASDFIIVKPGKLYESDSFRRMNVYLYNSEGVEIYGWHEMKAGETEIPVSFLSPGAYFIRIVLLSDTQENTALTNKFVIE